MVQGRGGTAITFFSKEGFTQGSPLVMFEYGIGILPPIRRLKEESHEVKQPWYADDDGAGGSFAELCCFYVWLQEIGPPYGYFAEHLKSVLIVQELNKTSAKSAFTDFDFKVQTGHLNLGGYVGSLTD
jgi:hypothetical protein